MLIPPHVALHEALEPLRLDLLKLQEGVQLQQYMKGKAQKVLVKGLISCVIADHPQACELSRHLGVNANQNCRSCWTSKEERIKFTGSILDHSMARKKLQTDVVVFNIKRQLAKKFSVTKQKQLQKECGVRAMACPLEGVEYDPHVQCFPDVDHLIDLGLMNVYFDYVNSLMGEKEISIISTRYEYLSLPARWYRINLNLKSGSKKMKPMSFMRKLGLLGSVLYRGLIDEDLETLLLKLLHLRGAILAPYQTDGSIKKVNPCFFFFNFPLSTIYEIYFIGLFI